MTPAIFATNSTKISIKIQCLTIQVVRTAKIIKNLLNAARKAVEHGYRVFILPNPKGFKKAM